MIAVELKEQYFALICGDGKVESDVWREYRIKVLVPQITKYSSKCT